jgi:hypothetical protein
LWFPQESWFVIGSAALPSIRQRVDGDKYSDFLAGQQQSYIRHKTICFSMKTVYCNQIFTMQNAIRVYETIFCGVSTRVCC